MMKYRYVFVLLLLIMAVGMAASSFSVVIKGIDGARGRLVNNEQELDIGNCNSPQELQDTVMSLRMVHPSSCTGQMDVYYSYYDFSTGTYTPEALACVVSSDENCRVTFNIWFGGKGDGTESLDAWAKFRAVCRKTNQEYTYNLPLKIVHTETQFEKTLNPKVIAAEQSVDAFKQAVAACKCCSAEYAQSAGNYDTQLNALKARYSKCDFSNIENEFNDLKKNADTLKVEVGQVKCENGSVQEKVNDVVESIENKTTSVTTNVLPEPDKNSTQQGSPCPAGAIILFVLGGLALAKSVYL